MTKTIKWENDEEYLEQGFSRFIETMMLLPRIIVGERKNLAYAMVALAILEGLVLTSMLAFKYLIDFIAEGNAASMTIQLVILLSVVGALRVLPSLFRWIVVEPMVFLPIVRLENKWPADALEKLLSLSANFHNKENTGKKAAKVLKAVDKATMIIIDSLFLLFTASIFIIGNIAILFWLDWRIAIVMLVGLPISAYLNFLAYKSLYPIWDKWESLKEKSHGKFVQALINFKTVQTYTSEAREMHDYRNIRDEMVKVDTKNIMYHRKYNSGVGLALSVSFVAAIVVATLLLTQGAVEIGTVVYVLLTGSATNQRLKDVVRFYTRCLKDSVAVERLHDLSKVTDVIPSGEKCCDEIQLNSLELSNVEFRYQNGPYVTDGVSFDVRKGEMVALVGPSGSGKSTIMNLIGRVYDVTAGSILFNGTDIREFNLSKFRSKFAVVSQDVQVFEGTIGYNISYAYPDVPIELIQEAFAVSCLEHVLTDTTKFPDGLETQVGEQGIMLSGGERQRVGIARAYIALRMGAEILILDEATASLDSHSESHIHQFIEKLREDGSVTIITISHRLSTVRKADTIYVMSDGKIIEQGAHGELLARNGQYKQMVDLQDLAV